VRIIIMGRGPKSEDGAAAGGLLLGGLLQHRAPLQLVLLRVLLHGQLHLALLGIRVGAF